MLAAHASPAKSSSKSSVEFDQVFDPSLGISPNQKPKEKVVVKQKALKSSKANSSLLNMFDDPDNASPSSSSSEDSSSSSSDSEDSLLSAVKSRKPKARERSERRNSFFNPGGTPSNREDATVVVTQALASTSHIRLNKISIAALKRFTDDIQSFKLREGVSLDKVVAYVEPGPREQIITVNKIDRVKFYRLSNKELMYAIQKCLRPPSK